MYHVSTGINALNVKLAFTVEFATMNVLTVKTAARKLMVIVSGIVGPVSMMFGAISDAKTNVDF